MDNIIATVKEEKTFAKGECNQCGECCKWLSFTLPGISNNRIYREYYKAHGCKIVKDTVLVPMTCPNLTEDNLCKIYENRPLLCKAFKGDSAGGKYWVPKECSMSPDYKGGDEK